MKKSQLILLILLIACAAVVISILYRSDSYSDFQSAAQHPEKEVQIIGTLVRDSVLACDSSVQNGLFRFYMRDRNGEICRVVYRDMPPKDFEKMEEIVVTGRFGKGEFEARSMLLKCPSKYNAQEKPEAYGEQNFEAGKTP